MMRMIPITIVWWFDSFWLTFSCSRWKDGRRTSRLSASLCTTTLEWATAVAVQSDGHQISRKQVLICLLSVT